MQVPPTPKNGDLTTASNPLPEKLKRLPHVFARVLELPFNSDTDVFVQETQESFLFVANSEDITVTNNFQAHVIEILPGVTKIEVRGQQSSHHSSMEGLYIDTWRFRLPATTFPQMVSARCVGGQLVVKVPKILNFDDVIEDEQDNDNEEDMWSDENGKEMLFLVE